MFQRILVAVDGSDTAELALQEAIKLANDPAAGEGWKRHVSRIGLLTA